MAGEQAPRKTRETQERAQNKRKSTEHEKNARNTRNLRARERVREAQDNSMRTGTRKYEKEQGTQEITRNQTPGTPTPLIKCLQRKNFNHTRGTPLSTFASKAKKCNHTRGKPLISLDYIFASDAKKKQAAITHVGRP